MSIEFTRRNNKIVLTKCEDDFLPQINEILTKVDEIEFGALMYNCNLHSILIPSNIKSISRYAFKDCYNLNKVIIHNGVIKIDDYAFCGCASLQSVVLPNSIETLGDGVFYGCGNLTNITIPSSLRSIGERCFEMCENLHNITIPLNSKLDQASRDRYKYLLVKQKEGCLLMKMIKSNNQQYSK